VRRLLIVDDDEVMRRLFRLNLADEYEIIDTEDPEQALALAMEHKPDAILLDMQMPKFSGFDLCRTFNSFSQTHLVPIFVVSGALKEGEKESCSALGATGFFGKPIDFDALRTRLATVKRHTVVPRSEVRVQLRVPVKLQGIDIDGNEFVEMTLTDNVSLSGFLCSCKATLRSESVVEVYLTNTGDRLVGKARCVRSDEHDGNPPQYAFRFIERSGTWILQ
jgi:DNA-binding response OmpR family regulator